VKNKCTALFIITSIFMLSLKDSISCIHTLLHYIPNNPWHQHLNIHSHHHIGPLKIHIYLQHVHTHEHSHVHDILDHILTNDDKTGEDSHPTEIKLDIKTCYFFQKHICSLIENSTHTIRISHQSTYLFLIRNAILPSPFQPPRLSV
jgi:hypothetical protein